MQIGTWRSCSFMAYESRTCFGGLCCPPLAPNTKSWPNEVIRRETFSEQDCSSGNLVLPVSRVKKLVEIIRNGHGIFSQLARLWRPWCFYFLRLGGFSKAEGGLWNLKFLMHLWSFYECRFEIIFGLAKYFKLTFKHKPCFHAKTNFGDISAPKTYKTATLSGLLS